MKRYQLDSGHLWFPALILYGANMGVIELGPDSEIQTLISDARAAISAGDSERAFRLLTEGKRRHIAVRDLDLLRARCFLDMDRLGDARLALFEELRHFPDNDQAKSLLETVEAPVDKNASHPAVVEDRVFQDLLQLIRPYTMLTEPRLFALYSFAIQIAEKGIPGNIVECGVAGGGSTALLASIIQKHSRDPRVVFACDSFEGMPETSEHDRFDGRSADELGWGEGTCAAPQSSLREIGEKLGVADIISPVQGYFSQTLPVWKERFGQIALLHIDADWYESTRTVLENLYDAVVPGGVIQFDDYGYWEGVRKAVHEFEAARGLKFELQKIDAVSAWMLKR